MKKIYQFTYCSVILALILALSAHIKSHAQNSALVTVNCNASTINITGSLTTSNNHRISILVFKDNAIVNSINDLVGPSFNQTVPMSGSGTYYAKVREVNNDPNEVNSPSVAVNCSSNPPSNPNPPSGSCAFSEGQYLLTTSWGEVIYAHLYNNILYAAYQNGSSFKPRHWLEAVGFAQASCFAEDDPHNGVTNPPSNPTNPIPPSSGTNSINLSADCNASTINITGSLTTSNNHRISILVFKDNAIVNSINDLVGPSFNQTVPMSGSGTYYAKVREVDNDPNQVNSPSVAVSCGAPRIDATFAIFPELVQYKDSAPPGTSIKYYVKYSNGDFIENSKIEYCYVVWETRYSPDLAPYTLSTDPNRGEDAFTLQNWQNVKTWYENGTFLAKGSLTAVFKNGSSNRCPYDGQRVEFTTNIKYLGNPGYINLNNSTNSPTNLACGQKTIVLSATPAENANSYEWKNIPSSWIGSRRTTNSTATFITDINSGATNVYVVAYRDGVPDLNTRSNNSIDIIRVGASRPTISSISQSQFCTPGNTTVSVVNDPYATSYIWQTTGGVTLISQSGTSATFSVVNDGQISAAAVSFCQVTTQPSNPVQVYFGTPKAVFITDNGSNDMCSGYGLGIRAQFPSGVSVGNWQISSGNAQNAFLNDYGNGSARFNSYIQDCYGVDITATNSCGTAKSGITICVNNCNGRVGVQDEISSNENDHPYPNPFSSTINIPYQVKKGGNVEIKIFDLKGSQLSTLFNSKQVVGEYSIDWDGKDGSGRQLSDGMYICRIVTSDSKKTVKLMLQRK